MSKSTETDQAFILQSRFSKAEKIQTQLKSLSSSRSPLDPAIQDLRDRLRQLYESLILSDPEFCDSHDVQNLLWRLHYRRIEEFRSLLSNHGQQQQQAQKHRHKIRLLLRSFLSEASGFYHELINKLKSRHGLPQDYTFSESSRASGDASKEIWCRGACHQCLVYLGDLARYKEQNSDSSPPATRDWSVAAGYYIQAITIWPQKGHPHNQLAVLATYEADDLLAMYRYFRSLASEIPFTNARENLVLLFETNRQKAEALLQPPAQAPEGSRKVLPNGLGRRSRNSEAEPAEGSSEEEEEGLTLKERTRRFRIRFMRMNGIIFTKTSLETFTEVLTAALDDLDEILTSASLEADTVFGPEGAKAGGSVPLRFLQMSAMSIFSLHNIGWSQTQGEQSYSHVLQRTDLHRHMKAAFFEIHARLLRHLAASLGSDLTMPLSPLLPCASVCVSWLALNPDECNDADLEKGSRLEEARLSFFRQLAGLLNGILDSGRGRLSNLLGLSLGDHRALWEDHELRGFEPLAPALQDLDFVSRGPARPGVDPPGGEQLRLGRLLSSAIRVSASSPPAGNRFAFDEASQRFAVLAVGGNNDVEEPIEWANEDAPLATDPTEAERRRLQEMELETARQEQRRGFEPLAPAPHVDSDDDDDLGDEMIVFKPTRDEGHAQNRTQAPPPVPVEPFLGFNPGDTLGLGTFSNPTQSLLSTLGPTFPRLPEETLTPSLPPSTQARPQAFKPGTIGDLAAKLFSMYGNQLDSVGNPNQGGFNPNRYPGLSQHGGRFDSDIWGGSPGLKQFPTGGETRLDPQLRSAPLEPYGTVQNFDWMDRFTHVAPPLPPMPPNPWDVPAGGGDTRALPGLNYDRDSWAGTSGSRDGEWRSRNPGFMADMEARLKGTGPGDRREQDSFVP